MIPVQLTLKNFMSYGEHPEELSFQDFHTACLSGDNGNGKSALLDAITWAVWGRTRLSGSVVTSDESLIRTGADEMAVRFEFEAGGDRYRIIKRLKRGTVRAAASLTASVMHADGTWKKLNALQGSMQKRIDKIVGMSFDLFVQSAYLLQGRWDMFSRNTPAKRRVLVSEALGLEVYDKLAAGAAEELRRCRRESSRLEVQIRKLESASGNLAKLQAARQKADMEVVEASREHALCDERLARVNAAAVSGSQVLARRLQLIGQIRADTDYHNECMRDLENLQTDLAQIQALTDAREAVERDYFLLQQLIGQRDTLALSTGELRRCEQELSEARTRLQQEEDKMLAEIRLAEAEVEAAKKDAGRVIEIDRRIAQLRVEQAAAEARASELGILRSQYEEAEQQFEQVRGRHDLLKQQAADYETMTASVNRQHRCAECESSLDAPNLQALLDRQKLRQSALAAEIEQLRAKGVRIAQQKRALTASVVDAGKASLEAARLAGAIEERLEERRGLEAFASVYDTCSARFASLQARHRAGDFGPALRIKVRQLEGEFHRLNLLAVQHQDIQNQISQLDPARERYQRLTQTSGQLTNLAAEVGRRRLQVEEVATRIGAHQQELDAMPESSEITDGTEGLEAAQQAVREALIALQDKQAQRSAIEVELQSATKAVADVSTLRDELSSVSEQLALNSTLTQIFGPDGIPYSILGNLVPRLQQLANNLLAALSVGKLSVELLLEKSAKSSPRDGAVLEILVHDGAGCRPYELFSGGEAFRVNFALRLALSQLLANVAGVPLNTIFIDEGFGSQDGSGRQRIVEMLHAIQHEFAKVIVITHVDEIKDSFSTRIEVTRDVDGSHIHLVGGVSA
jgi:exonuclease SbcC